VKREIAALRGEGPVGPLRAHESSVDIYPEGNLRTQQREPSKTRRERQVRDVVAVALITAYTPRLAGLVLICTSPYQPRSTGWSAELTLAQFTTTWIFTQVVVSMYSVSLHLLTNSVVQHSHPTSTPTGRRRQNSNSSQHVLLSGQQVQPYSNVTLDIAINSTPPSHEDIHLPRASSGLPRPEMRHAKDNNAMTGSHLSYVSQER
jgi:hypothetical protein